MHFGKVYDMSSCTQTAMPAIVVGHSCPLAEVIWRKVEGTLQVPFWPFVHGECSRGGRLLQLCSPGSLEGGLACTMAQAAPRRSVRGSGAGAGLQAGDRHRLTGKPRKYVGESFLRCSVREPVFLIRLFSVFLSCWIHSDSSFWAPFRADTCLPLRVI